MRYPARGGRGVLTRAIHEREVIVGYIPPEPPQTLYWLPIIEMGATYCAYCGSEYHSSKFHPGTCGNCGGPRGRETAGMPKPERSEGLVRKRYPLEGHSTSISFDGTFDAKAFGEVLEAILI